MNFFCLKVLLSLLFPALIRPALDFLTLQATIDSFSASCVMPLRDNLFAAATTDNRRHCFSSAAQVFPLSCSSVSVQLLKCFRSAAQVFQFSCSSVSVQLLKCFRSAAQVFPFRWSDTSVLFIDAVFIQFSLLMPCLSSSMFAARPTATYLNLQLHI